MKTVQEVYGQLKEIGVITSMREFSRWCGRRDSWTSSSICRNKVMPVETLVHCYLQLLDRREYAIAAGDHTNATAVKNMQIQMWDTICQSIQYRKVELSPVASGH